MEDLLSFFFFFFFFLKHIFIWPHLYYLTFSDEKKLAKGPSIHVAAVTWDYIPPPHITEIFDVLFFWKICGFIWPGNSIKRKSLVKNTTLLSVGKRDMRYHFGLWWSPPRLFSYKISFDSMWGSSVDLFWEEEEEKTRETGGDAEECRSLLLRDPIAGQHCPRGVAALSFFFFLSPYFSILLLRL